MNGICVRLTALGAAIIAASTLFALLAETWWVAELFAHFRIQYIVAGLLLFPAALLLRRRTIAIVALVTIGVNGITAHAFSSGGIPARASAPTEAADSVPEAESIRIVSANVRARNGDPSGLIEIIHNESPDAVLVIEHTEAFEAAFDALGTAYRYRVRSPTYGHFGIALYSRLPLLDAGVVSLGATDAVRATIGTADGEIRFIGTHLMPPMESAWARERNAQLGRLTALLGDAAPNTIVCGDFNLTPYSPYFSQFVEASGLHRVGSGRPLTWTWPAGFIPFGVPIDHCFTGDALTVAGEEVLGDIGSDHYPLRIDISVGSDR